MNKFLIILLAAIKLLAQGTWTTQVSGTSATLYGVHFINEFEGTVVGDSGVILQTKNSGQTWSKSSIGNYVLRSVQFLDSNNGYIVGYNSSNGIILKTTNGGNNWDSVQIRGICLSLHFMNKDTGIVVGRGPLIIKTTDGGCSWNDLSYNHGIGASRFINDVCFVNDRIGFIVAGDSGPGFAIPIQTDYLGQICKTTDGGESWKTYYSFGTFYSVRFSSDSVGIATGFGAGKKTTDGGTTWNPLGTPFTYGLCTVLDNVWWSVGPLNDILLGVINESNDGGKSWSVKTTVSSGVLYCMYFLGQKYGYAVGAKGTILRNIRLTSVEGFKTLKSSFSLSQNYPNPFNPSTTIKYSLPNTQFVTIKIFDMLGRDVASLVNENKSAGSYEVKFDGGNLSSGIYFYRMQCGSFSDTKKFILMK